ncbi:MAG: glycosyltransferase family 39 protein [Flavobacteriales bacterium]|nr:glycosyltransferase family 39 protein [Flavobacteriales bacterium]
MRHLSNLGIGILLLNLLLKVIFLDSQPIAGDEPFSIYMAGMAPREIVAHLMTGNNPPLWELLLHYWTRLFGIGPFAVRFMPLVFSSVTALVLFRIGARFFHWRAGLTAALLFTFSDYHVFFSHEARCYALLALLTALALYLFLRVMEERGRWGMPVLALGIVNILLVYTHFFGLWVLFMQLVCALWMRMREKEEVWAHGHFLALGMALVGYLPYLPVLWQRFTDSAAHGTWVRPPNGLDSLYTMLWNFSNQPLVTVACILILVGGLVRIGMGRKGGGGPTEKVVVAWFLVPFLLMFGISYVMPMWLDRYLVHVTPAYYLTLAVFAHGLFPSSKASGAVSLLLVVLFATTFHLDVDNRRDIRSAVAKVRELRQHYPASPVYLCPDWADLSFLYYWDTSCFENPSPIDDIKKNVCECLRADRVYPVSDKVWMDSDAVAQADHVIYLDAAADFAFPDNGILPYLKDTFAHCERFHYPEVFYVHHCSR